MTNTSADRLAKAFSVFLSLAASVPSDDVATWGNVVGRILSSRIPAVGASVQVSGTAIRTTTDPSGNFVLSGIPLDTWEGRTFDLEVRNGSSRARLTSVGVRPGAQNATNIQFDFAGAIDTELDVSREPAGSPLPEPSPGQPSAAGRLVAGSSSSIFATREGLVGLTTANGHVIVEDDHFVALPSRRALNRSDALSDLEFEVEVVNGSRTARLPVWDVGPWNTKDDWWNTSTFRQSGSELPRWTPWAQAAFSSGFNSGLDQSGRLVKNPAGIDLGDGAFRQDLSMIDNGTVGVRMDWQLDGIPGQRVGARHWAKVRASPGGTLLDTVLCGTKGTLLSGPDSATISSHWYLFYQVRWDDGTRSGWSAENFLAADTSISCMEAVRPATRRSPLARIVGNRLIAKPGNSFTEFVLLSTNGSILLRSGRLEPGGEWILPRANEIQFVVVRSGIDKQILTRFP